MTEDTAELPRRRLGPLLTVAVWACVVPFAVWAVVRVAGWERGFVAVALIAFTPYVAAASLIALALPIVSRRWWAAGVAAIACVALASCVLPRWFADSDAARPATPGLDAVFMTSNLRVGGADAARVVAIVRDHHVDVLAVQELTVEAERALDAAGLADLLPHRVTGPLAGVGGTGLYSRYPITEGGVRESPSSFRQAYGTVTVPGARPVTVESMHPAPPTNPLGATLLVTDLATAPEATLDGPVRVLIGDFNSTLDHAVLRRLIGTGYRDAAAAVGRGTHADVALLRPAVGGHGEGHHRPRAGRHPGRGAPRGGRRRTAHRPPGHRGHAGAARPRVRSRARISRPC